MRPTLKTSLMALCVFAAGFHAGANAANTRSTQGGKNVVVVNEKPEAAWSMSVVGEWMGTHEDAVQVALEEARAKIIAHLRSQKPPLAWAPSVDYVRQRLVKDLPKEESGFKDEKGQTREVLIGGTKALEQERKVPDVGTQQRVCLKVAVNSKDLQEMRRLDSEYRAEQRRVLAQERQLVLVKILLGVVAVLAAAALYFRFDEATKGYYTNWLRLAAVSFVGVVGAMLWFVSLNVK